MKRIALLLAVLGAAYGCANLFSPSGCTKAVFVTDTLQALQGADTSVHVDTLAKFKLCASS